MSIPSIATRTPCDSPNFTSGTSPTANVDSNASVFPTPPRPQSPQPDETLPRKRKKRGVVPQPHSSQSSIASVANKALKLTTHHLVPDHPQTPQDNQIPLGKRKKVESNVEGEKNVQSPKQTQQEETPKLSSSNLIDNPASKSYELFELIWLLRIVHDWKTLEKLRPGHGRLPGFYPFIISYIKKDLRIKETSVLSLEERIKGMLSKKTELFLTTDRSKEKWSEPEKEFFRIMVFDPEHHGSMKDLKEEDLKEDTLITVAITLCRPIEDCRREWQELFKPSHSSSETTLQPSPETVPNRLEDSTLKWDEWEQAMISLWIKKLEQINPAVPNSKDPGLLWGYCNTIAESFYKEPSFKMDPSNPFQLASKLFTRFFSQTEEKDELSSLFRDRSKKVWLFIEKEYLKFKLGLSNRENAKENLRDALSRLGRAPLDVELTPEYLKALKVQIQIQDPDHLQDPEVLKLNTELCKLLDSENLKDADDNSPNIQNSTACSRVQLDYSQSTAPSGPSPSNQEFMQEAEEEGIIWHDPQESDPRQELDPEELFRACSPSLPPTDMDVPSTLFDDDREPNELSFRFLSSLLANLYSTTTSTEEVPPPSPFDDTFDQAGMKGQGSTEEPPITEEEERKRLDQALANALYYSRNSPTLPNFPDLPGNNI